MPTYPTTNDLLIAARKLGISYAKSGGTRKPALDAGMDELLCCVSHRKTPAPYLVAWLKGYDVGLLPA